MSNQLILGEPRLGGLFDGDPDTDPIVVMLRDTGHTIELEIPLSDTPAGASYRHWWSSKIRSPNDGKGTESRSGVPRSLGFRDNHGSVVLLGCRGPDAFLPLFTGRGRVVANHAILGATRLNYERINGMRTEIPALRPWADLHSITWQAEEDDKKRATSVTATAVGTDKIRLSRRLNLTMRSIWDTAGPDGEFTIREKSVVETKVGRPRAWHDHLRTHAAVLDLVSIAAWNAFGYKNVRVHRADDPLRDSSGREHGPMWPSVVSHQLPAHKPIPKNQKFLFHFDELGTGAIAKWLDLRKSHARAIGPLVNILRSERTWSRANVVLGGIALEALGYVIEVTENGGENLTSRDQLRFRNAVTAVVKTMEFIPLDDCEGWVDRACQVHRALKHPDKPEPDSLDAINTLRETLLVIRCWIALRLGVQPEVLESRLRTDALAYPYEWADGDDTDDGP